MSVAISNGPRPPAYVGSDASTPDNDLAKRADQRAPPRPGANFQDTVMEPRTERTPNCPQSSQRCRRTRPEAARYVNPWSSSTNEPGCTSATTTAMSPVPKNAVTTRPGQNAPPHEPEHPHRHEHHGTEQRTPETLTRVLQPHHGQRREPLAAIPVPVPVPVHGAPRAVGHAAARPGRRPGRSPPTGLHRRTPRRRDTATRRPSTATLGLRCGRWGSDRGREHPGISTGTWRGARAPSGTAPRAHQRRPAWWRRHRWCCSCRA